jgi:hypothetical protein
VPAESNNATLNPSYRDTDINVILLLLPDDGGRTTSRKTECRGKRCGRSGEQIPRGRKIGGNIRILDEKNLFSSLNKSYIIDK